MKQLDLTKPVQTRDGRTVRILCTDARIVHGGHTYSIVGLALNEDGSEVLMYWDERGFYMGPYQHAPRMQDLINVPVKRRVTGWLNVYPDGAVYFGHKAKADLFAISSRIACVPIEIEVTEGDGLDGAQ